MQSAKFYLDSLTSMFSYTLKTFIILRTKIDGECKSSKVEFLQFAYLISAFQIIRPQQLTET